MEITILGQPYSKANSRRFAKRGDRLISIRSEKALNYETAALYQLKEQVRNHTPFSRPVAIEITIFYSSYRPDLDESLILDILQKAKVYENDRLIREKHIYHEIDKTNPRAEIVVWMLED